MIYKICRTTFNWVMKTVIFACSQNAGRSQIASWLFNKLVDTEKAISISAGTDPVSRVYFEVVVVMASAGVDLTFVKPQLLSKDMLRSADLFINMGCEKCVTPPGLEVIEWNVPDPMGRNLEEVRAIRDRIRILVSDLVRERGWKKA